MNQDEKQEGIYAKLVHQYSLSKTLRFELKPIGITAKNIKKANIISTQQEDKDYKTIGSDFERAKAYKIMKRMLDVLHREFIEETLNPKNVRKKINGQDIKSYHDSWTKKTDKNNPSSKKAFQAEQKDLAKKLKEVFDETAAQIRNKYEDLFSKEQKKVKGVSLMCKSNVFPVLCDRINKGFFELEGNRIYCDEKNKLKPYTQQELEKIYQFFDKFHTYFTGFQSNRENVYNVSGEKDKLFSTSIAHRLFEENLIFHFQNIEKWETIQKSLAKAECKKELRKKNWSFAAEVKKIEKDFDINLKKFFKPEGFIDFFSQSGIDRYNQILGGNAAEVGKEKTQGINEKINLTRQQSTDGSRRNFPPLHELYKQILSKGDKIFIEEFENEQSMLEGIQEFHQEIGVKKIQAADKKKRTLIQQLIHDVDDHLRSLTKEDLETHKIDRKQLRNISIDICGDWNTLDHWRIKYLEEKKELSKKASQKTLSFTDVQVLLDYMLKHEEDVESNHQELQFYKAWKKDGKKDRENFKESELKDFWKHYILDKIKDMIDREYNRGDDVKAGIVRASKKLSDSGILNLKELAPSSQENRKDKESKRDEQIAAIKAYMDACLALSGFVRDFLRVEDQDEEWKAILDKFSKDFPIMKLYNKVRNRITKKKDMLAKIKVNFENSTLLAGWDQNRETANLAVLFEKNGLFYLGIMHKNHNKIFEDIPKASGKACYKKMIYKLLPGPNKMLPKVFFADKNLNLFAPSEEILKINKEKLYTKENIESNGIRNLHKYIDFCKESLKKHPEWSENFGFDKHKFPPTKDYESIDVFYNEVASMGYSLDFENVSEDYINQKIEEGELYFFQIYNKDFSQNKKKNLTGKDNLHTLYWKSLFAKENLSNVIAKLNGEAEIFFRPASIHYLNGKKEKGHHHEELKNKFSYPILKNRRFSEDKYLFHVPITLNFNKGNAGSYNQEINELLANNLDQVNVIGIDRGEKHLLYYSVINQKGDIIEQKSLNTIKPKGSAKSIPSVDYQKKLSEKEGERQEARKTWSLIENIKEIKSGYLSQVVHELAQLIIKHNAIVVLEDLNMGFKRSRFKFEKQVYQKFEKSLIDKLNYLVFKNVVDSKKSGHHLKAYQLTAPFISFERLGKQSGILFYTTASYTSTTDPVSGFLKNVYFNYTDLKTAKEFWESFEKIYYNKEKKCLAFEYHLDRVKSRKFGNEKNQKGKEEKETQKKIWTVYSNVDRACYLKDTKTSQIYNVSKELKKLLEQEESLKGIDLFNTKCIKDKLAGVDNVRFHKELIRYFNGMMNMRVLSRKEDKKPRDNDFILSPVKPFFDSRKAKESLPQDGDANGAYNIARKGICILNQIREAYDPKAEPKGSSKKPMLKLVSKQDWECYAQSEGVVQHQEKKYKA